MKRWKFLIPHPALMHIVRSGMWHEECAPKDVDLPGHEGEVAPRVRCSECSEWLDDPPNPKE